MNPIFDIEVRKVIDSNNFSPQCLVTMKIPLERALDVQTKHGHDALCHMFGSAIVTALEEAKPE